MCVHFKSVGKLDPVERFISTLLSIHPDMRSMFTPGGCFEMHRLLRSVWPDAIAHYDAISGHVYTEIEGRHYDITGRVLCIPDHCEPLSRTHKPHRWGKWRLSSLAPS